MYCNIPIVLIFADLAAENAMIVLGCLGVVLWCTHLGEASEKGKSGPCMFLQVRRSSLNHSLYTEVVSCSYGSHVG